MINVKGAPKTEAPDGMMLLAGGAEGLAGSAAAAVEYKESNARQ